MGARSAASRAARGLHAAPRCAAQDLRFRPVVTNRALETRTFSELVCVVHALVAMDPFGGTPAKGVSYLHHEQQYFAR
jgi:hypothetical protein